MTYNEKKSLYESIMKEVAKTVKRRLNENNLICEDTLTISPQDLSANLNSDKPQTITFKKLYITVEGIRKFINFKVDSNYKGIFVESSNEDIQFAALNIIKNALSKTSTYQISAATLNANSFKNLDVINEINKYKFIIIPDFSYAQKSAIPVLLNLADGRIWDKKITPKVIVICTGSNDQMTTSIAQRFNILKLVY